MRTFSFLLCLACVAVGFTAPLACGGGLAPSPLESPDAEGNGDAWIAPDGRDGPDGADDSTESANGDDGADGTDGLDSGLPLPGDSKIPKIHRPSASACTEPRGPDPWVQDCGLPAPDKPCTRDQDCTSGRNGRCECPFDGPPVPPTCSYDTCESDTDCNGKVCNCRESPIACAGAASCYAPNTCLADGNCRVDSDCGDGGYCSPSTLLGCGATCWDGYYCHTSSDECTNDSDCVEAGAYCAYDGTRWVCSAAAWQGDG